MSKTKSFTKHSARQGVRHGKTHAKAGLSVQRGAAMLEALIGMLILSIALLGSLLAMSHGMRTQHVNSARSQTVDQLRGQFLAKGAALCGTTLALTVNTRVVQVPISCTPYNNVTVGLPGAAVVAVTVPANESQIMTARLDSPLVGGVMTVSSAR